ncbi:MAG: polysaccharide biosynthesis C-terminal domain-containing protein [Planctomycetaceae bacterium]
MSVKKNVIAGWLGHLVTVLIGFFLMPYILGILEETRYGVWLLLNAVAAYSGLIYAGFGATICRYVADSSARKEWDRMNQFVSSIQSVYFGSATLVVLATIAFALAAPMMDKWGDVSIREVQTAILVIGSTIAMGMVASVYGGVLIGTQQLHIKRAIEVTCGITRGVLTVLFLKQQWGLVTLSLVFFAVTVLEHGLSAWFAYRVCPQLSVSPKHIRRDVLKECFGFSTFNAIALAAEYLIYFTDTIVIGLVLGPKAIVPYQIGLRIAQMIQMPIAQIGEAILPKAGELHANAERGQLGALVAKAMGVAFLLAGGFLIGGYYFGDQLVSTWMGRSFTHTHTVMVILLATQVVSMPMVIIRKALLGSGEVKTPAFIDLLEAVSNLALSLILVHYWGIVGVAIGTFVPLLVIESSLLLPFAMKRLHITRGDLLTKVVGPAVPSFVLLFAFCEIASRFELGTGWGPLLLATACGGGLLVLARGAVHILTRPSPVNASSSAQ